jgi:hemolysin-activating ACP:hemolysin acyltransferase
MKIEHAGFEFHFPTQSSPVPWSRWEIVGMAAWLWARSELHRSWNLALLEQEVMDSVQLQQFVLLTHQGRPAGYLSWGHLSEEAEVSYIADPHSLSLQDKCSGPYLWLLNWVAPQGGTEAFTWVARHHLFHSSVGHMLRVKPGNHELARLVSARGSQVPRQNYAQEVMRVHGSFQRANRLKQDLDAPVRSVQISRPSL